MKALSLKQPWAWLVVTGQKPIENRKWATKYRGPLLIHASSTYDHKGELWILDRFGNLWQQSDIVCGAVIGQVDVVDVVSEHASPWFFGPRGWILERPIQFSKPIHWRGQLGIFDIPDDWTMRSGIAESPRG